MQSPKPYREKRPWGEFVEFTRNTPSTVKIITVNSGELLSLQTHSKRDEFWQVLSGNGNIEIGDEKISVSPGDRHFIPRTTKHRIMASDNNLVLLEISFGDFDEKDIVRLDDKYGRAH